VAVDGIKEILAAFEARVKSKILGSVVIAFIATNWKVIFYVIFEKVGAEAKFEYFDDNTDLWSLIAIPLFAGFLLSVLLPWVNYLGLKLTSLPDQKQRQFKNNSQHLDVLDKLEYQTKLQEIKSRQQKVIVDAAKATEDANEIKDPELRKNVQKDLEEAAVKSKRLENLSVDSNIKNQKFVNVNSMSLGEIRENLTLANGELVDEENEFSRVSEELKLLRHKEFRDKGVYNSHLKSLKGNDKSRGGNSV